MIVAGTTLEEVLLILKIAFLVLLYLFVARIVRTAGADVRVPQESFIMRPAGRSGAVPMAPPPATGSLVVV
jgi:hypothetical protein